MIMSLKVTYLMIFFVFKWKEIINLWIFRLKDIINLLIYEFENECNVEDNKT